MIRNKKKTPFTTIFLYIAALSMAGYLVLIPQTALSQEIEPEIVKKQQDTDQWGKLRPEELEKKREGWYFTGIPFVAYNTDNGVIFGGRVFFFSNGPRDGEFFDKEPYNLKVFLHLYFSSSEYMIHSLNLDTFHLGGTSIRLQTALEYEHNINANYFGTGVDAFERGLIDASGKEYATAKSYSDNFLLKGDKSYAKYANVRYMTPRYYINLSGEIVRHLKVLGGFEVSHVFIEPWDNKEFMHDCQTYRTADDSLFSREQPVGHLGGWTNFVRFGIAWDTRDFEPNPNQGVLLDTTVELSSSVLGSDYDYQRITTGARFYTPVFIDDLIFAARFGFTTSFGNLPFYEMGIFPFMFERSEGLKHNSHLKGYKFARFVAPTQLMANIEIRWKFLEFYLKKHDTRFAFQLVPFFDAKNGWDELGQVFNDHRFQNYKLSYGASIIIAWNLSTVMRLSFGFSPEDFALSMSFGQTF